MSGLNSVEKLIIKRIRGGTHATLSEDNLSAACRDVPSEDYTAAINSLLRKKAIFVKRDKNDSPFYTAPSAAEIKKTATMEGDEAIVYNYIRDSDNMGMWTKLLKGKSGLHQTAINKCLKTLEGKGLIKTVQNIKWPTRKTYMLSEIQPSVEITGGPWYTDEDLDTEFINKLMELCEVFIRKASFPKRTAKSSIPGHLYTPNVIYPPSRTKNLPTPQKVTDFLATSDISQTKLGIEHVMQLMAVLAYDGKIEIIKLSSQANKGGADGEDGWGSDLEEGGGGMDSEEERREMKERERRKKSKKREREEESDDESSADDRKKRKAKKAKKEKDKKKKEKEKKKKEKERKKRKKERSRSKSKSRKGSDDDEAMDSDELRPIDEVLEGPIKSKKSKKKIESSSESDSSSDSSSDSDTSSSDSDDSVPSDEIDSKSYKLNSGRDKARAAGSNGQDASMLNDDGYDLYKDKNVVYRSLRQKRETRIGMNEAPCGKCPQFSFCSEAGPVNPKGCEYFKGWLEQDYAE